MTQPGRRLQHLSNKRLVGLQSRSGSLDKRKIFALSEKRELYENK
jgi:hypothetical protein